MFEAALGLVAPWQVTSVEFDKDAGELQIGLGFPRGSRFACPIQGCVQSACVVHDTLDKRWRHLDFFEHRAFLTARVPRVECGQHGIHLVEVSWARPGSGFTLLMEVAMLTFAKQMPIAPLARMAASMTPGSGGWSSTMSGRPGRVWTSRVSPTSGWTRRRLVVARTTSRSLWIWASAG